MKNKKSQLLLYLIIALISGGILISQVILSVILGLLFQYDFRFLIASLALLGLGIGGIIVSLFFEKINNKVTFLLGNPIYSHVLILSSILFFGGVGGLIASKKIFSGNIKRLALLMVIIMLIYYFLVDNLTIIIALPFFLKILLILIFIAVPSFFSGMLFPLMLHKGGNIHTKIPPWLWGIDAIAFVSATLFISFAVLFLGIKIILIFGAVGYALAAATARSL